MELPIQAWEKSVLVVAHPDDEILWFSSILDKVSTIVICFTDAEHHPELGEARRLSLAEHAYKDKIVSLELRQVKSHNMSRWPNPEESSYGLRLSRRPEFDAPYKAQASRAATALAPHIQGADNVFTHNPWGEYGHEDHVQINRVVTQLARDCGAAIWYDSYVSNKSSLLMRSFIKDFGKPYYTMPVDADRARQIADTYHRNGAWTWMDDYVWFSSESFVQGPLVSHAQACAGTLFPVNYLRVPFDPETANAPPPGFYKKLRRRLRRLLGKQRPYSLDVATG